MKKNIDRIAQVIDSKGLSVRAFELSIGASNGAFGRAIKNKTDVSSDWLSIIIEKHPEINPSWLLTGVGEMLKGDNSRPVAHSTFNPQEGIPLIPISAMAGCFTDDSQILEYECERFVVPTFKGAEFLISVKGSSMYPKYNSGDIVACKRLPLSDLFFQWNKVYVLDTNQGPLIKRIQKGSDDDHILIVSDNEKYTPFELHISKIHAVAIVLGVIRLE